MLTTIFQLLGVAVIVFVAIKWVIPFIREHGVKK